MRNYPDTTWEADPRAPWNEESPTCGECAMFCDGVCARTWEDASPDEEACVNFEGCWE